jgi:hypothetical protein
LKPPSWDPSGGRIDYYYWFHGTAAMRSLDDPRWHAWREAVWAALLPNQRTKGHVSGSFDAAPDPWGDNGGRVYATAINALTLVKTLDSPTPDTGRPSGAGR